MNGEREANRTWGHLEAEIQSATVLEGFRLWQSLDPSAELPNGALFEPMAIPHLLGNTILMEVSFDPMDFKYRVIGDVARRHFLSNYIGVWLSEIEHQKAPSALHTNLSAATLDRRPVVSKTPYVGPQRDFKTNIEVILPMVDDHGTVTRLLVFIDFVHKVPAGT